ncbi:hypothetical protein A3860_16870 [Niastella vici]|uniref:Uncharacterized protein n=1 Tax=Niastella vici TaxID=1703345 RepID=A0A1V9G3W8_9BACT|nr:hypothetical protein A3860_16870 [Niastella vici]
MVKGDRASRRLYRIFKLRSLKWSAINGLVKFRNINPYTVMAQMVARLLSSTVNQSAFALVLKTNTNANAQYRTEKIMSVQKPVNE